MRVHGMFFLLGDRKAFCLVAFAQRVHQIILIDV